MNGYLSTKVLRRFMGPISYNTFVNDMMFIYRRRYRYFQLCPSNQGGLGADVPLLKKSCWGPKWSPNPRPNGNCH